MKAVNLFKPFAFLQKMRRAVAKFLFSFFSSKFAVMLIRSTAIACNVLQICVCVPSKNVCLKAHRLLAHNANVLLYLV